MTETTPAAEVSSLLSGLGVPIARFSEGEVVARSPIDGGVIGRVPANDEADVAATVEQAHEAFLEWRSVPAPKRGELVRLFGEALRGAKTELARLVTLETGKIVSEGLGEVQEMIDVCDFAVGLSRQLHGLTIASERADHHMAETWRPLGVVGVISAFNFPVAVWAWNAAIAIVCGNAVVWKPSEKTPLTALAVQSLFEVALARFRYEGSGSIAPENLSNVVQGGGDVGAALAGDRRVALVSATGSTAMGRGVAPRVAARFARSLLELGGNNAAIVCPSADLDLTVRAVAFSAMGTAGQRCTSLRRLFVHDAVYDRLIPRLREAYASVPVGDPRALETLVGPLIDEAALDAMTAALNAAKTSGASVFGGDSVEGVPGGRYVRPALVELDGQAGPVLDETFAPILYVMRFSELGEAIRLNNAVAQGLSSSIFTNDLREAELFLSERGSDCGIANVNIGPSGAEIGGAFGGEKETGGGRESGSDAWKTYMRRQTATVNYGSALPLAQGVTFNIE